MGSRAWNGSNPKEKSVREREITKTIRRQNRWKAFTAVSACLLGELLMWSAFKLNEPINYVLFFCATLVLLASVGIAWAMGQGQRHDILVTAKGMSTHQLKDYIRHLNSVCKDLETEDGDNEGAKHGLSAGGL
jgi:hypothetical protein